MLEFGDLRVEVLSTPGHTAGMVSLLVNGTDVFTADVLFKGTVGGTFAPGNTGYDDHKRVGRAPARAAAGDRRAPRPHASRRRSATSASTTRSCASGAAWTPRATSASPSGTAQPTLVLWAPDYDGTNKAWVRFHDDGSDGIVGGSQVQR